MKEGSNCLFSSWPLSVLLYIPTHKGSKGKVWCGLQNLVWKEANQSSLCTLRRPQTSAEILPRVCVLPQLRFCLFSLRKLPEYIQHIESLFLVLLLLHCMVFGQWLNFSLVSTVKMKTTNSKTEQGCELIEYQLLWDCHIKNAKSWSSSL